MLGSEPVKLAWRKQQPKRSGEPFSLIFPNSLGTPDLGLIFRIQKIVEKVKASGFKWEGDVTMHQFRKNFATLMHRAGCEMATVRDLLGHSDVETTQLYVANDASKAVQVSKIAFAAFVIKGLPRFSDLGSHSKSVSPVFYYLVDKNTEV